MNPRYFFSALSPVVVFAAGFFLTVRVAPALAVLLTVEAADLARGLLAVALFLAGLAAVVLAAGFAAFFAAGFLSPDAGFSVAGAAAYAASGVEKTSAPA